MSSIGDTRASIIQHVSQKLEDLDIGGISFRVHRVPLCEKGPFFRSLYFDSVFFITSYAFIHQFRICSSITFRFLFAISQFIAEQWDSASILSECVERVIRGIGCYGATYSRNLGGDFLIIWMGK